MFTMKQEWRVK
jgi:hypothetical protein